MSSIEIHRAAGDTGFDFGPEEGVGHHLLAVGASAVVGCLLFAVSRKVTWGVDEPVLGWRQGLFSVAPYFLYLLAVFVALHPLFARKIAVHRERLLAYVRSTRLPALWTVALALYVGMHVTSLSALLEDPVYNSLSLSLASFSILTVIYVTAALGLVVAFSRRRKQSDLTLPRPAQPNAVMLGYAICLPLFLLFVFFIPLQS